MKTKIKGIGLLCLTGLLLIGVLAMSGCLNNNEEPNNKKLEEEKPKYECVNGCYAYAIEQKRDLYITKLVVNKDCPSKIKCERIPIKIPSNQTYQLIIYYGHYYYPCWHNVLSKQYPQHINPSKNQYILEGEMFNVMECDPKNQTLFKSNYGRYYSSRYEMFFEEDSGYNIPESVKLSITDPEVCNVETNVSIYSLNLREEETWKILGSSKSHIKIDDISGKFFLGCGSIGGGGGEGKSESDFSGGNSIDYYYFFMLLMNLVKE